MRAELNVPWSASLTPHIIGENGAMLDRLQRNAATIARMAKLGEPVQTDGIPAGSAQILVDGVTIAFTATSSPPRASST